MPLGIITNFRDLFICSGLLRVSRVSGLLRSGLLRTGQIRGAEIIQSPTVYDFFHGLKNNI